LGKQRERKEEVCEKERESWRESQGSENKSFVSATRDRKRGGRYRRRRRFNIYNTSMIGCQETRGNTVEVDTLVEGVGGGGRVFPNK